MSLPGKVAVVTGGGRGIGRPWDIAKAVLWLASPDADFVTGQCFTIDGGLTAASPLRSGFF